MQAHHDVTDRERIAIDHARHGARRGRRLRSVHAKGNEAKAKEQPEAKKKEKAMHTICMASRHMAVEEKINLWLTFQPPAAQDIDIEAALSGNSSSKQRW